MKMIDTHCHIQFDAYDDDRTAVVSSCKEKEVGLIVVGCDLDSSRKALDLVSSFPSEYEAWCTVGQHPTDTGEPFDYKTCFELARSSKKVVAIGECGLDYYHLPEEGKDRAVGIEKQKDLLFQHLNLAHEVSLPLIIHCRDAHDDMIDMLVHRFTTASVHPGHHEGREHGVLHCFTGTARDAQGYLDLGFMISFTGIITFTNQYDDVVRTVPFEKMLIETDAPFLAPVPHRGKRNSPEYVEYVARRIAEIKEVSFDDVVRATTENARRLFGLPFFFSRYYV
jgi:TatD DNase family protein